MTSHVIWADSPVKKFWREDRVAQLLLYFVRVSFLLPPPRDLETRFRMGRDGVLQCGAAYFSYGVRRPSLRLSEIAEN